MYYGGDPVEWTSNPAIPREARYEVMNKPLPPPAHPPPAAALANAKPAAPAAAAAGSGGSSSAVGGGVRPAAAAAATAAAAGVRAGSKVVKVHPLADVGGYQMPSVGRIGGAKGLHVGGSTAAAAAAQQPAPAGDGKVRVAPPAARAL